MGFLVVFLGGGIGAALRHGVNLAVARVLGGGFNYATLFENVSGSLVMGLLVGYFTFKGTIPAALATVSDHRHSRRLYHLLGLLTRYGLALSARRTRPRGGLCHRFRRAFDRRPSGRPFPDAPLCLTFPRGCALWAREIASSTSFSAPRTSSHLTIVTHLPFSRSL
jgi:fluoride ion exporter CrcB/FEX